MVRGIRNILRQYSQIEHINEVLTMHMGPDFVLTNISVDFRDNETANSVESVIAEIDKAIKTEYLQIKRIFIEAEARKITS